MNYLLIFGFAVLAGALYSVIWWIGTVLDPKKETTFFSIKDLLLTMAVGAAVGLVVIYGQLAVIKFDPGFQVLVYGAMTAGFRKGLVTLWDRYIA